MSEDAKPKSISVIGPMGGGDPENCMHCRVRAVIGRMVMDQLGGKVDVNELLGALITFSGELISEAPTPRIRKAFLRQAEIMLRKESRPADPSLRHEH